MKYMVNCIYCAIQFIEICDKIYRICFPKYQLKNMNNFYYIMIYVTQVKWPLVQELRNHLIIYF